MAANKNCNNKKSNKKMKGKAAIIVYNRVKSNAKKSAVKKTHKSIKKIQSRTKNMSVKKLVSNRSSALLVKKSKVNNTKANRRSKLSKPKRIRTENKISKANKSKRVIGKRPGNIRNRRTPSQKSVLMPRLLRVNDDFRAGNPAECRYPPPIRQPSGPSARKSAFQFFTSACHEMERMGNCRRVYRSVPDEARAIAQTWHDMSSGDKAMFINKERNDCIRFELEQKAYYDE